MSYILSGDSGTVVFDRTGTITNESPTMSSQVTSNPIEGGGKITAHAVLDPIKFSITGIVSPAAGYATLEAMWRFAVSFQQITITSAAFVDIQAPAMSQQDASAPVAASAAKSAKSTTQNGLVTTGSDYAAYVASFNSKNTNPSVATGRTNPSYAGYNREAIK